MNLCNKLVAYRSLDAATRQTAGSRGVDAKVGLAKGVLIVGLAKGVADYTIRGVCGANNLFLLSRASSDAYEPYMILKDLGEESLTPSFSSTIPLSRPKSPCPCPCRRPCP
jgi:hypothetical protein